MIVFYVPSRETTLMERIASWRRGFFLRRFASPLKFLPFHTTVSILLRSQRLDLFIRKKQKTKNFYLDGFLSICLFKGFVSYRNIVKNLLRCMRNQYQFQKQNSLCCGLGSILFLVTKNCNIWPFPNTSLLRSCLMGITAFLIHSFVIQQQSPFKFILKIYISSWNLKTLCLRLDVLRSMWKLCFVT